MGILTLPRLASHDLKFVDGQHRILGFHLAFGNQNEEMDAARGKLATLQKRDDATAQRQQQRQVAKITTERQRLAAERVSVQIVIVDAEEEYNQMFVDIAENAKGITQAVKRTFDSRDIVNRCLPSVMDHDLLRGRVDTDKDRIVGRNENLTGVKHVADIIRTVQVGISARITKRRESELTEAQLIDDAMAFLDTLMNGFDDLFKVAEGTLTPIQLRQRSLLGSVTMQRALAGVYHELRLNPTYNQVLPPVDPEQPHKVRARRPRSDAEVARFFQSLAPHMSVPIQEDSIWATQTQQFEVGAIAPGARAQQIKALISTVRNWAIDPPEWL